MMEVIVGDDGSDCWSHMIVGVDLCGCRDQNPRSDCVLNAGLHVKCGERPGNLPWFRGKKRAGRA